jgi:hypothetical protein
MDEPTQCSHFDKEAPFMAMVCLAFVPKSLDSPKTLIFQISLFNHQGKLDHVSLKLVKGT